MRDTFVIVQTEYIDYMKFGFSESPSAVTYSKPLEIVRDVDLYNVHLHS